MSRPAACRSLSSWSAHVRLGLPLGGSLSRAAGSRGGSALATWPKRRRRAERILLDRGGWLVDRTT
ncbi:hypothetical protein JOB18_005657 [Solea senegalensis]|uniref:Uncharacterized protein n=1 Tax=Solea senegalensis TaxID=28829 RepID=A0AAV6PNM2_SOLSE|nr:hypothetical protein JOB18_005657 [Solea senegalensis]